MKNFIALIALMCFAFVALPAKAEVVPHKQKQEFCKKLETQQVASFTITATPQELVMMLSSTPVVPVNGVIVAKLAATFNNVASSTSTCKSTFLRWRGPPHL